MEIHIGDRVADVTLVNKEGNRVELTIDGKPCVVPGCKPRISPTRSERIMLR